MNPPPYALGHSARELERLATQARLIDPITRRCFRDAGIGPGQRVLDVGSGAGDVAFLVAELVGTDGAVVGTDLSLAAVAAARARAAARSLDHVSFHVGDPATMDFDQPFDAVVGRYVLMFAPDPAAMLRRLVRHLRPGGLIAFHEPDWDGARSNPAAPTYDRCYAWVAEALRRSGHDIHMGAGLPRVFAAAGLPEPTLRLEVAIGAGTGSVDCVNLIAGLACTLQPAIERFGIATAAEIGADTLAERLRAEAAAKGSVIVGRSEVGAWARI